MKKFIKFDSYCAIRIDAIREIRWNENGTIDVYFSSVEHTTFHSTRENVERDFHKLLDEINGLEAKSKTNEVRKPDWHKVRIVDVNWGKNVDGRIIEACSNLNIRTLGELAATRKIRLSMQRQIGQKCLDAISEYFGDNFDYIWQ